MVDAAMDPVLSRANGLDLVEAAAPATSLPLTITTTSRIDDVEGVWRALEKGGVESPGQSFDFIRQWIAARHIPAETQLFVVVQLRGTPLLLLPLMRQRKAGIRALTWFPGSHVGCGAPLIDAVRFAALTPADRTALWQAVMAKLGGADLVHLPAMPERAFGLEAPFAELGRSLPTETLYRASFTNWEEANTTQRSKSRRKHDRQQGERLEALGKVEFAAIDSGDPAARPVLDEMFRQRARRFEVMGVADPFAAPDIARFYADTVAPGSRVGVRLHVLRLDGVIVAVRYNIVHGNRLFCLISSMSDDERIQGGSPGKQCLLRVMQTVFDEGYTVFDMGNGFTDEKRHWCNVQIPLRTHYVPLTLAGRAVLTADAAWQGLRTRIKSNPALLKLAKSVRARLHHAKPEAPASAPDAD